MAALTPPASPSVGDEEEDQPMEKDVVHHIIVMVTGYRDWESQPIIEHALQAIQDKYPLVSMARLHPSLMSHDAGDGNMTQITLVHGDCRGADRLTAQLAEHKFKWSIVAVPADWNKYGKAAGPLRNQKMIDEYKPHHVIALLDPASRGTVDCINRVKLYGSIPGSRLRSMTVYKPDGKSETYAWSNDTD